MNLLSNQKGLTLLELIISVGLLGIIMAAGLTLYLTGIKTWKTGDVQLELQQNARIAIKTISEAVRDAKIVEVLDEEGKYVVEGNRISIVTNKGENIEFYYKDKKLMRKKNHTSNTVANYVENIVFKKESSLIFISIEVKKEDHSVELETKIFPRNSRK